MKDVLKIIGGIILSFLGGSLFYTLFVRLVFTLPLSPSAIIAGVAVQFIVFVILLSLFWALFLRDKNFLGSFFQSIRLKKTFVVLVAILGLLDLVSNIYIINDYKKRFSLDKSSNFLAGSVYENSQYNFRLTYPEGSVFANANPEHGFVTRFFLPSGQTIKNDQENVGVYVKEDSEGIDTVVEEFKRFHATNGPIDVQEILFGGKKGYKILFVSSYSASKGTKELTYMTVKDGVQYHLNYFPVVDQSLPIVENVADSFTFTQNAF